MKISVFSRMPTDTQEDHIAVLMCDSPIGGLSDKFGDLGDLCCQLVENLGISKFKAKKYVVYADDSGDASLSQTYMKLISLLEKKIIKGLILSGSRSDSFDTKPWILRLDEFLRSVVFLMNDFPIVGLCFGHQIISKNLGCKVDRNLPELGWECGITTINLNPEIFSIENNQFLTILKEETPGVVNDHLNLPEMHRDIVYGIPGTNYKNCKFLSIGSSPKCSIQGLVTGAGPIKILTFQGHPEFTTEFTLELLKNAFESGRIDKQVYEKSCYNTKILNNQGPLIAKIICQFINSFN